MELEELEKSFKELKIINRKQEKRVYYHETRARNLTIGYLLLQALFFLGFSSRPPPNGSDSGYRCQWWVPFSMILVSSVIFFMAFLDAVTMFYRVQYHLDVNYLEQDLIYKKIQEAKQPPPKSHVSIQLKECHTPGEVIKVDVFQLLKRKVYIYVTTLSLLALTGLQFSASSITVGEEGKDVEEKKRERKLKRKSDLRIIILREQLKLFGPQDLDKKNPEGMLFHSKRDRLLSLTQQGEISFLHKKLL